ncbi:unnamed protein product, partial [Sphacelaria rigidula]
MVGLGTWLDSLLLITVLSSCRAFLQHVKLSSGLAPRQQCTSAASRCVNRLFIGQGPLRLPWYPQEAAGVGMKGAKGGGSGGGGGNKG